MPSPTPLNLQKRKCVICGKTMLCGRGVVNASCHDGRAWQEKSELVLLYWCPVEICGYREVAIEGWYLDLPDLS